jgi:hypothetical protein
MISFLIFLFPQSYQNLLQPEGRYAICMII